MEFQTFLRVWVDSAPEDDSRLALWTPRASDPGADCGSFSLQHASLGQVDDMPAGVSFFRAVYTGTRPG